MKIPSNFFQMIEAELLRNPKRLSQHHWHEVNGREAIEPDDIESADCSHCLFGWIIAMTPGGASVEFARAARGQDPVEVANRILVSNGRLPLPPSLAWDDEKSALKTIRGRAAEERAESGLYAVA